MTYTIESLETSALWPGLLCQVTGERTRLSSRFWAFAAMLFPTAQTATLCAEMCRARGLTVVYPAGETAGALAVCCPHQNPHYASAAAFCAEFAPLADGCEIALAHEPRPECDTFCEQVDSPPMPTLRLSRQKRYNGYRLSSAQWRVVEFLRRPGAKLCINRDLTRICATNGVGYLTIARSTFLALNRRGVLAALPHRQGDCLRFYALGGVG